MAIIGAAIKGALGGYGDKPKVPRFQKVDFGEESGAALQENLENLPAAAAFAEQFNQLSADQMMAQLERMLPGYGQLLSQGTSNIRSLLAGEVPGDVENQLERKAAERGVTLGYGGSDFGENQFLRNFGLTSLQLTQQGLNSAMQWMNMAQAKTPVFNMASAFVPITERVGIRTAENQFQWQRNWLKNQISAMPDPFMAALGDAFIQDESTITSLVGSAAGYAGGAAGGGGGGGGGL